MGRKRLGMLNEFLKESSYAELKRKAEHRRGLGGVVGLMLPMARADRGSRPVYYLPWTSR